VISVNWTLGLQFVNFIILLLILNKMLYKPLSNIMAERKQAIDGSHEHAQGLEADIEDKMQRYQAQLSEAKKTANEERNRLKKAATEEESKILSEAQAKATARLQTIKSQVGKEAAAASKTLKSDAESLAGQIATKVLGRELA